MSQLTQRQIARQAEKDIIDLLVKLSTNIALIFSRAAIERNQIIAQASARREASRLIRATIAGENGHSAYSTLLMYWVLAMVYSVGIEHAQRLAGLPEKTPSDTLRVDPLYMTPYDWVDPNGMRLQDRIDHVAQRTAQQFDRAILLLLLRTEPADLPAKIHKLFTVAANNTGSALGYESWRLMRHEMNRMYGAAIITAGSYSPIVAGIDWALSPRHPKQDHCDIVATIAMDGTRIKEPYTAGSVPNYPDHVYCLCSLQNAWQEYPAAQGNVVYAAILSNPIMFTVLLTGQSYIPQSIIRNAQ